MTTYNGIIKDFDLIIEDHGIFTFTLVIDDGLGCTNLGLYKFSDGKLEIFIHDLMKVLGVKKASDIVNLPVRIDTTGGCTKIGHIIKNRWVEYENYTKG